MTVDVEGREFCERCERLITDADAHDLVCGEESVFDGECPMCGQPYRNYMGHLQDCPGDRSEHD